MNGKTLASWKLEGQGKVTGRLREGGEKVMGRLWEGYENGEGWEKGMGLEIGLDVGLNMGLKGRLKGELDGKKGRRGVWDGPVEG